MNSIFLILTQRNFLNDQPKKGSFSGIFNQKQPFWCENKLNRAKHKKKTVYRVCAAVFSLDARETLSSIKHA